MKNISLLTVSAILTLASLPVPAVTPKEFRDALISLHQQMTEGKSLRMEIMQGKYEGARAANMRYTDAHYFDSSNMLVSHIQSDADDPRKIHIIEVNIMENGKIIRDFGSISLPWAPDLPIRSMINLHQYNEQLHSFRQYNLYGDVDYEACEGTLAGKKVRLSLDGSDIKPENTGSDLYKACFKGMSTDWEAYSIPH